MNNSVQQPVFVAQRPPPRLQLHTHPDLRKALESGATLIVNLRQAMDLSAS